MRLTLLTAAAMLLCAGCKQEAGGTGMGYNNDDVIYFDSVKNPKTDSTPKPDKPGDPTRPTDDRPAQ